ncbi:MAG: hypothetical protein H5T90_07525 [Acetomicrobium sp.]|jgi:hypothetical protein|uniref:hypothetical protein n=1 Tax=Acetomicrobium sp. UBA5826 TaxID=1946039 RepID=UPI0019AA11EC|nr:hypothetical protein [Acetomicrobium sp. UBA5826]MBC7322936.1 hypothetical protein [Acetomicrobium sp.]
MREGLLTFRVISNAPEEVAFKGVGNASEENKTNMLVSGEGWGVLPSPIFLS